MRHRSYILTVFGCALIPLLMPASAMSLGQALKPKATINWYYKMSNDDENVKVTLLAIKDPAPSNDFISDGDKYVGIRLVVKNLGKSVYNDTPGGSSGIVCADHASYDGTNTAVTNPLKPDLDDDATLMPGEQVRGWVTLEVPKTCVPRLISFDLDDATEGDPAYWRA